MSADINIRPYRPADRSAVREIACDTADRGKPGDGFYPDRKLIADLLTRYYTDFEPESSWAAEGAGKVVGYLNGCLSTRRYARIMAVRVVPRAVAGSIARGALLRPETWKILSAGLKALREGGGKRGVSLREYPAHLHVNLRAEARGQKVGESLVEAFTGQARAAGISGIHLSVREDNLNGRRFFERLSFKELSRYAIIQLRNGYHSPGSAVIYGKRL